MTAVRRGAGAPAPGYDAELRLYNHVLRRACAVQARERVLDVGCGAGQTTREAARAARDGSALGVDISAAAVERARELARAEGLVNVAFERADAQVHAFPQEHFDLAMSRFGTMFFDDPVIAFTTIRGALRPSGRLVVMVWQPSDRNEWDAVLRRTLAAPGEPPAATPSAPDPFSLADPPAVRQILAAAGFADIEFTDVHRPVYSGPDADSALTWVRTFTCTTQALAALPPDEAPQALHRLHATLAAHRTPDGIWFDSRAWLITARRA